MASAAVRLLVAAGYIPEINYDLTQWGGDEQLLVVYKHALYDCLKGESLPYTILATGTQEAYTYLRPPIDSISYIRPTIGLLYMVIAACFFVAAVDRRKAVVFSLVLLAGLLANTTTGLSIGKYLNWAQERSS